MIWIYEGRIGSGKTYCENLFLKYKESADYCREEFGVEVERHQFVNLTLDQIPLFHRHCPQGTKECPTLVFIDEAQIPFNANEWKKTDSELLEFLTQSRRAFMDVIFVTQHADNINKQFRRLVASYVFHVIVFCLVLTGLVIWGLIL